MGYGMIMKIFYMAMQAAYAHGLRPILKSAIDDPDSDWDESVMAFLDRIFDYKKK